MTNNMRGTCLKIGLHRVCVIGQSPNVKEINGLPSFFGGLRPWMVILR